ncbi:MAG: O-antigen ligase family protein, partial [Planctomycetaceae bacterium]|nr:O-antigen ligase family protein [Planctomycetaceae bacterium]
MHDSAPPLNGHRPPRRDRSAPLRDHRLDQNRSLLTHLIRLAALGGIFAASAGSIPPFETSGRVGDVLLLSATTMCLWGALRTPVRVWMGRVFSIPGFWLAAFVTVYALSAFSDPSATAFKHTAQIVVVSIVFLFFSTLDQEFVTSRSARLLTFLYALYLVLTVFFVNQRIVAGDYTIIKNAVGGAVLGGLGLLLYMYTARYPRESTLLFAVPIYLVTGVILGMFVDHRMLMILFVIALPMCVVLYGVWNHTWLRRGVFWATVGLIVLNIAMNVRHEDLAVSRFLHELSIDFFGRRFFSGREDIWIAVLQEIEQQPWFGHGAGVVPSRLINSELSS